MENTKKVVVKAEHISKTFNLPHEQHSGIKQIIINTLRGKKNSGYEKQHVLRDVSFEVHEGDFFGIVGRNGSGKSTLLKILSGIYTPDEGAMTIDGSLVPFIELGVGFNPELTGRENIFLNGALLGFNSTQVAEMYDDIVTFAELDKFMDQKLKNYSSGMQVRLAFSIAIRAKSDILVLDEVLAVGDEAFQRKCFAYFAELKKLGKTVILVTHDMASVQQFCTKAMLIDKGHKTVIGSPLEIAQIYRELNGEVNTTAKVETTETVATDSISLKSDIRNTGETIEVTVDLTPKRDLDNPMIGVEIFKSTGEQVYRWTTDEKVSAGVTLESGRTLHLALSLQNIFPVGEFSMRVLVRKADRSQDYGVFDDAQVFSILNTSPHKYDSFWKPEETYTIAND